jgi:hypothetical protein
VHAKHDSYDSYRSKRSSTRVPAPQIASYFELEATENVYKLGNENQVEPLRKRDDNRGQPGWTRLNQIASFDRVRIQQ